MALRGVAVTAAGCCTKIAQCGTYVLNRKCKESIYKIVKMSALSHWGEVWRKCVHLPSSSHHSFSCSPFLLQDCFYSSRFKAGLVKLLRRWKHGSNMGRAGRGDEWKAQDRLESHWDLSALLVCYTAEWRLFGAFCSSIYFPELWGDSSRKIDCISASI